MAESKFVTPPCFESHEQYASWMALLRKCANPEKALHKKHGYCMDCTSRFQKQMKELGKCNFPDVKFSVKKNGAEEGRRI